jgi:adenylate cyclase, class 2
MPLNLELKVKLSSHKEVKNLLKKIEADSIKTLNQKDIYYKIKNGLLKLRIENGQQSIIKYLRNEKGKDRFSDFEVLHFSTGDAEKFFKELFKIETTVEKKRKLYMYDNTRIHLDEVQGLGSYLELETLVINGKADAKKRFKKIIGLLALNKYVEIRKSYRDLMLENKRSK